MGQGAARRFEFDDGKSSKFWEIEIAGAQFAVRYGKIATAGQMQTKDFADATAAAKAAEKLIAEKTGKGYQEVGGSAPPIATSAEAAPAAPTKKAAVAKTKAAKPADLAKDPDADPGALEVLAGSSEAIDRLLAKNPKAGAALLEKLSHSSDKTTRNHLVLHPNAPKEVLVKLAHQFPADFFKNPAFDWMLIEDPDLMQRIGGNVLGTLLKRPDCPQSFLNWAVKRGTEKERLAVAMNAEASVAALSELASQGGNVAEAAKAHAKLAEAVAIEDPFGVLEEEVRKELAASWHEHLADEISKPWEKGLIGPAQWLALNLDAKLEAVAIDIPGMVRRREEFASSMNVMFGIKKPTDDERLKSWCKRLRALGKKYGTAQVVSDALDGLNEDELRKAAESEIEALKFETEMQTESWVKVRLSLLAKVIGVSASRSLFEIATDAADRAAQHTNIAIRLIGLSQRHTAPDILAKRAKSSDWRERLAVACNPSCPPATNAKLRSDSHQLVAAGANLGNQKAVAVNTKRVEKAANASGVDRMSLTHEVLRRFGSSSKIQVGGAISRSRWKRHLDQILLRDLFEGVFDNPYKIVDISECPDSLRINIFKARAATKSERQFIAENLNCPVEILEDLARDTDAQVRASVARNHDCPLDILETLTNDRSEQVRRASAFSIVERESVDASVFHRLAKNRHSDVREIIASKATLPVALFENLINDQDEGVRSSVAENPKCPPHFLDSIARLGSAWIRFNLAANPACPSSILDALAKDEDPHVRSRVAGNVACSSLIFESFAKDGDVYERRYVASNPECPVSVIGSLSQDENADVRMAVAANPSCPDRVRLAVLTRLSTDESGETRAEVARNQFCPSDVLTTLGKDADPMVRMSVAQNAGCPGHLKTEVLESLHPHRPAEVAADLCASELALATLAKHEYEFVRAAVARNPACPPSVLESLAKDEEFNVRNSVAGNPACPIPLLEEFRHEVASTVLGNKACPNELFEKLARIAPRWSMALVVQRTNCPDRLRVELLEKLAMDAVDADCEVVAKQACCPSILLDVLVQRGSPLAVWFSIHHPNVTAAQLNGWARDETLHPILRLACAQRPQFPASEKLLSEEITRLAETPPQVPENVTEDEWILAFNALAMYPKDKKDVAKSAKAKDWLQRAAATFSPDIQPNQLKLLLEDSEEIVRQLAADRLRQRESAKA